MLTAVSALIPGVRDNGTEDRDRMVELHAEPGKSTTDTIVEIRFHLLGEVTATALVPLLGLQTAVTAIMVGSR